MKLSIPSNANFKALNLYIRTKTNSKPPSKQDLKEESCLQTGEISFKRSIYILDTSNIQIAGWASLNLVWNQTPSAVCLLTYSGFLFAFGHFSQHPWNSTHSSKGTEEASLPCPPTCWPVLLFPHIQQTAVTLELLLPANLFICHH